MKLFGARQVGSVWLILLLGTLRPATALPQVSFFSQPRAIVVNAADDAVQPPRGTVTLRAALAAIRSGGRITFAASLNGREIRLTRIGAENTPLVGESFPAGVFAGFVERDYGRSALYVRKNVTLDASALPQGVTIRWAGDASAPARVLAVYGNLTLKNIVLAGGRSVAAARADSVQPFTLARGGALAVWGTATLTGCTFVNNAVSGDTTGSRDRGAFGGAIYGNRLILSDCLIAGNAAVGFGAAGGGVYSVGGAGLAGSGSSLTRCVVSGNRVQGQHAYGGGVYSDGGGPGNRMALHLVNCTIARNLAADHPDIPDDPRAQFYVRGGGVYMSNGSLNIQACTILENAVTGSAATFRNRPNLGGGGIAATIGNAHVVETMQLAHSLIAGNTVNDVANDVYTGSLINFHSSGYNLIGVLDMSQLLVPAPLWQSLHRRHWPAPGDAVGVALDAIVDRAAAVTDAGILSAGTDAGAPVVLAYPPRDAARDRIPAASYTVPVLQAQWSATSGTNQPNGQILTALVARFRRVYPEIDLPDFGNLDSIVFLAEQYTWPSLPENTAWIDFWHRFDAAVDGRLGPNAGLGDGFWSTFLSQPAEGPVTFRVFATSRTVRRQTLDQTGRRRPSVAPADIGAIESP